MLLLEAGPRDTNPAIGDPNRVFELKGGPEDYDLRTVPQPELRGRQVEWPRGRVLGGSSAVNGMLYVRGWPGDFDHWSYLGNHGWSYADVLPLLRRSEDYDGGESEFHGVGGPWHVTSRYDANPIHLAIVEAGRAAGFPVNADPNGAAPDGIQLTQLSTRDGRRETSYRAFLGPVADHAGLEVLTDTRAVRLLLDGERCTGVEVVREGRLERLHAEDEVVVCTGAVESPRLLTLSGIAGEEELQTARPAGPGEPAGRRAQPAGPRPRARHLHDARGAAGQRPGGAADGQPAVLPQPARPRRARPAAAGVQRAALRRRPPHGPGPRLHVLGGTRPAGEPRHDPPALRRPRRRARPRSPLSLGPRGPRRAARLRRADP